MSDQQVIGGPQTAPQPPQSGHVPLPPPQLRGADDRPAVEGIEAVAKAANGQKLKQSEAASALDWFLSDEPVTADDGTKSLEINVGGSTLETERWIKWRIKRVDVDELRRIQRLADSRARRDSNGDDGMEGNLRVIVAGTVDPDLKSVAQQKGVADPAMVLRMKFAQKSGLLPQIAAEIMSLSGFDNADVREAQAGNG